MQPSANDNVIKIQTLYRSFHARKCACDVAQNIIEKIFDPKSSTYYYYNSRLDTSRWTIPFFLVYAKRDIIKISPTYTKDEASTLIQKLLRRRLSQKQVRRCLALIYEKKLDEDTNKFYYYNKSNNSRYETKSNLWGSEDIINYNENEQGNQKELIAQQERKDRRYPRSKIQKLVDDVEDAKQNGISLTLSRLSATHISRRIYGLSFLKTLNLSKNRLSLISPKIMLLRSLETLDLSYNFLTSLPAELGQLKNLRELNFSHNSICQYPSSIYSLDLRRWYLGDNKLRDIQVETNLALLDKTGDWKAGIGMMKQLKEFEAEKNEIETFPKQLELCSNLIRINLAQNKISSLPECIGSLHSVRYINLSKNKIKSVPLQCKTWSNIEELIITRNLLASFPNDKITCGWKHSMKHFDVSFNKLREIPDSVQHLAKMNKLVCAHNDISSVSEKISKLIELNELNLSHNLLADLPISIFHCKRLKKLVLDSNRLQRLPSGVCQLFSLTYLSLRSNQIEQLGGIGSLLSLQYLDVSWNRIEDLDHELYRRHDMTHLFLSNNMISFLSTDIVNFTKLKTLDLSFNMIREIPPELKQLEYIRALLLSNNQAKSLPFDLTHFRSLLRLDASGNSIQFSLQSDPEKNAQRQLMKVAVKLYTQKDVLNDEAALLDTAHFAQDFVDMYEQLPPSRYATAYDPFFCLAVAQSRVANFYLKSVNLECDENICKVKENTNENEKTLSNEIYLSASQMKEKESHQDRQITIRLSRRKLALTWFNKAKESWNRSEDLFKESGAIIKTQGNGGNIYYNRALCNFRIGQLNLDMRTTSKSFSTENCSNNFSSAILDIDEAIKRCPNHIPSKSLKTQICLKLGKHQTMDIKENNIHGNIDFIFMEEPLTELFEEARETFSFLRDQEKYQSFEFGPENIPRRNRAEAISHILHRHNLLTRNNLRKTRILRKKKHKFLDPKQFKAQMKRLDRTTEAATAKLKATGEILANSTEFRQKIENEIKKVKTIHSSK